MRARVSWGTIAASLVVLVTCIAPLREDQFLCEEAHARLVDCCPGFSTDYGWCTHDSSCESETFPALSAEESRCVKDSSCERLRDDGICQRAASIHEQNVEGGAEPTPARVCP